MAAEPGLFLHLCRPGREAVPAAKKEVGKPARARGRAQRPTPRAGVLRIVRAGRHAAACD